MNIDHFPSPKLTGIIFRDEEGFDEVEVVVAGRNSVKVGGRGERAEKLFLHYAQRSDLPRTLISESESESESDLNGGFNLFF